MGDLVDRPRRYVVYAHVSEAEHAVIRARARAAGLSIAEYVRCTLNTAAFLADEEADLLKESYADVRRAVRR